MKICSIIAEFNPLHNGHKYLIDSARSLTGADFIVVVMSGDYVQRGEPSIVNKYCKTKMALEAGADIVFELPVIFATGSAQYFARGAVSLLNSIGSDYLFFGSETGDLKILNDYSYVNGQILGPNDTLASEYLNALKYLSSNIEPYTIKRQGSCYNNKDTIEGDYCSASYIREHLSNEIIKANIPYSCTGTLSEYLANNKTLTSDDYSSILFSKLVYEKEYGFDKYFDIFHDLSCKIIEYSSSFESFTQFASKLKSKDIALSHINRALLHIILDIKKSDMDYCISNNYSLYARLLGFKNESKDAFKKIKDASSIPIISKMADAEKILSPEDMNILNLDIKASTLYSHLSQRNITNRFVHEASRKIIII